MVPHSLEHQPRQAGWYCRRLAYADVSHVAGRFWSHVDRTATDGCWPWTASTSSSGYGQIRCSPRTLLAHRLAWVLQTRTNLEDQLTVDHLCRNRLCMRAEHMELVTRNENTRRRDQALGHTGVCAERGPKVRTNAGKLICRPCKRASSLAHYHAHKTQVSS